MISDHFLRLQASLLFTSNNENLRLMKIMGFPQTDLNLTFELSRYWDLTKKTLRSDFPTLN